MRHFLSDQRDRARAAKRGGGAETISLDAQKAEERYHFEPADRLDAEKLHERRWAMTLLEQALVLLRDEMAVAGKKDLFDRLKGSVAGESEVRCGQVATELGLSESATKSALHRLRKRYRELPQFSRPKPAAGQRSISERLAHSIDTVLWKFIVAL